MHTLAKLVTGLETLSVLEGTICRKGIEERSCRPEESLIIWESEKSKICLSVRLPSFGFEKQFILTCRQKQSLQCMWRVKRTKYNGSNKRGNWVSSNIQLRCLSGDTEAKLQHVCSLTLWVIIEAVFSALTVTPTPPTELLTVTTGVGANGLCNQSESRWQQMDHQVERHKNASS